MAIFEPIIGIPSTPIVGDEATITQFTDLSDALSFVAKIKSGNVTVPNGYEIAILNEPCGRSVTVNGAASHIRNCMRGDEVWTLPFDSSRVVNLTAQPLPGDLDPGDAGIWDGRLWQTTETGELLPSRRIYKTHITFAPTDQYEPAGTVGTTEVFYVVPSDCSVMQIVNKSTTAVLTLGLGKSNTDATVNRTGGQAGTVAFMIPPECVAIIDVYDYTAMSIISDTAATAIRIFYGN